MFGSRNRCTKSRKERNYAPPVANSWLRHWKGMPPDDDDDDDDDDDTPRVQKV